MKHDEIEVRERWGNTEAFREYTEKTKHASRTQRDAVNDGLMAMFAAFAACRNSGAAADSKDACVLAEKLQAYITEHYYTCTDDIFAGLGTMYTADARFRENIDKYGNGTAAFASAAIAAYCKGRQIQ